ncbi:MAG: hypothetical protein AAFU56_08090, partial [Pseudomonadota bacterium]
MNRVIDGEVDEPEDEDAPSDTETDTKEYPEEDPLVAFPPYGFRYLENPRLNPRMDRWQEQINLDPRLRVAAQLGAKCVRVHQEELMKAAWEQYSDIIETNRALLRLQTAEKLAGRITNKRFEKLPSDIAVSLCEPLTPYTRIHSPSVEKPEPKLAAATVASEMERHGSSPAYATRDLRRIAASRQRRNAETGRMEIPVPNIPGNTDTSPASQERDGSSPKEAQTRIRARDKRTLLNVLGQGKLLRNTSEVPLLERRRVGIKVRPFSTRPMKTRLRDVLNDLPRLKADYRIAGRTAAEANKSGIVYRAPRIPVPLSTLMMRINPSALMAGIKDMPDNTVAFFQENRSFVEGLMLGANHEINEELRWRRFPTDMRATVLPRFWDRGAEDGDIGKDDIGPITAWNKKLGKQFSPVNTDGNETLVVVIKGDIVRILDEPIVRMDLSPSDEEWEADPDPRFPTFSGKLGQGLAYYGFDISLERLLQPDTLNRAYFVILEPPGRLSFGLDQTDTQGPSALPNVRPPSRLEGVRPTITTDVGPIARAPGVAG